MGDGLVLLLVRRLASFWLARLVLGLFAMLVKLPVWSLAAARARLRVPPLQRGAGVRAACGAKRLAELEGLTDLFLTSADGTVLHAVVDDGGRRQNGKRPLVFVHGFPEMVCGRPAS
eukprot:scaffold26910_cov34-Tisochrysis_lutea.AAC.6